MGIKNINITLAYANIVGNTTLNTISFLEIDKKYTINFKGCKRYIKSLPLVVSINATQSKENASTIIDPRHTISLEKNYIIRIRLSEEISNQFIDLGEFVITPQERKILSPEGYEIFKHIRLCMFENITLLDKKSEELFLIKILIKPLDNNANNEDTWIVQAVYPIYFTEENN